MHARKKTSLRKGRDEKVYTLRFPPSGYTKILLHAKRTPNDVYVLLVYMRRDTNLWIGHVKDRAKYYHHAVKSGNYGRGTVVPKNGAHESDNIEDPHR